MPCSTSIRAGGALVILAVVAAPFAACGGTAGSGSDPVKDGGAGTDVDGRSSADGDGGLKADGAIDASSVKDAAREANVAECPSAYSASPPGHCTVGVRCGYDQGTCECAGYCGGVAPPPDVDFTHWRCAPTRTDGCPDEVPTMGAACAPSGKQCQYDNCCATDITCQSGVWGSPQLSCPP